MKRTVTFCLLILSLYVYSPLHAQCVRGNLNVGQLLLFKTTGDPQLDQRFNEEGYMLYRVFNVSPNLLIFDDRGSSNAFALPVGPTGTVCFGIGLIRDELWRRGEHALAGIMAHEFAHILQFQHGCPLGGRDRELHADFLAGYYLSRKGYFTRTNIFAFAQSLFEKGDYWDPSHHGTPDERVAAMMEGFKYGGQALPSAYSSGMIYASSY